MKNTCLLFVFLLFILSGNAQSSWVNRLSPNTGPGQVSDSATGILNMAEGADGSIFVIATISAENMDKLYKVSPSGYPVQWGFVVGGMPLTTQTSTRLLAATPDSGCITAQYGCGWSGPYHCWTTLVKYNKTGSQQWSTVVHDDPGSSQANDLVVTAAGGYYLLCSDSLLQINAAGVVTFRTASVSGKRLFEMPGGDLVVLTNNSTLVRTNTTGTVSWTTACNGNSLLTLSQGFIVGVSVGTMFRINTTNGSSSWSLPIPFSNVCSIDKTPAGGFVGAAGIKPHSPHGSSYNNTPQAGTLFEVNAAGAIIWSHSYTFPKFGLTHVVKTASGNILTGGAFSWFDVTIGVRLYNAFMASLDSSGNGRLNTTSYTWPGNANNNGTSSLLDDGLYIALAYGDTGPPRDDTIQPVNYLGLISDFASDWTNVFANGANHKHADTDGNGIVNAADLSPYAAFAPIFPITIPSLRLTRTPPDLRLIPQQSSATPGGNIKIYVVVGAPALKVDSLFGITFSASYNSSLVSSSPVMTLYTSDFGNASTNLLKNDYAFNGTYYALASRRDHQNVYAFNDTIGEINMTAAANITTTQTFNFQIIAYKALTASESPVLLSPVNASVTICPPPVITQQPVNRLVCAGSSTSFTVVATGSGLTYQWYESGWPIVNGGVYSGATTSVLTLTGVTANMNLRTYSCIVSSSCPPAVTSNSVTLTVDAPLSVTITDAGFSLCGASTDILQVSPSGSNLLYQWFDNANSIPGATGTSLETSHDATYTCTITNQCGANPSLPYTLTLYSTTFTPSINYILANGSTSLCSGGSVLLYNQLGNFGGPYQWYKDGVAIPGANSDQYTATQPGKYMLEWMSYCWMTGGFSMVPSNWITVTLNANPPNAAITAGGPLAYCPGGSVLLNANTGQGLTYQWLVNGIIIPAATNSSFLASRPGDYSCIVSANCGSANSNVLTVTWTGSNIFFTQPGAAGTDAWVASNLPNNNLGGVTEWNAAGWTVNGSNMIGRALIRFDLSAVPVNSVVEAAFITLYYDPNSSNANGVHYGANAAWLRKVIAPWDESTITWNNQPSVTGINQATVSASITSTQDYSIDITSMVQEMVSQPANNFGMMLQLQNEQPYRALLFASSDHPNAAFHPSLRIFYHAASVITTASPTTICPGSSVLLNANMGAGLTYQWKLNNVDIPGATSSFYAASSSGSYTCNVSRPCGAALSNVITVNIQARPTAVITASGPVSICQGSSVKLNAQTDRRYSYQWLRNGSLMIGATDSSFLATAAASYACIVSDSCAAETSNVITVSVHSPVQAVISTSDPLTFCSGSSAKLLANTGNGITYQWQLNGADIPGATLPTYDALVAGVFTCRETDSCGSTVSNSIITSVNTGPSAVIQAGGSTTFCSGGSVVLNANIGSGLSYQWKLGINNIAGATASVFTATTAGSYTCVVSNNCGGTTSNAIVVTVNSAPTATITAGGSTSICTGGSVTLNANTGTGLSYQWKLGVNNITGATSSSYSATAAGSYTCVVTNSCGSNTSNAISVTTGSVPAPPGSISGQSVGVCNSQKVYSITAVSGATSYSWNVPTGVTINSGQGTTSLTVTFSSSFSSGVISVTAGNSCGNSSASSLAATGAPAQPGTISGPGSVCKKQSNVAYSIASVTGATSYTWSLPPGAQVTSGQNTASIIVKFGNQPGNVTVKANNSCGSSAVRSLAIVMPCRDAYAPDDPVVSIFPNPTATSFTLLVADPDERSFIVIIRDMTGREVERREDLASGATFDFGSKYASGVYMAEIRNGEYRKVLRLVKEN